jgi:NDP-sugar pyrophosphorylase family protein
MKAYILAGGLGTRVSSLYPDIPKALIPVCGKPFISWKIEQLRAQGFEQICLLLGHKAEIIRDYLQQREMDGALTFINDGKQLRGTGGAILNALNTEEERFILTFGDNLLPLDIQKFTQYCEATDGSVMTITSFCGPSDIPNVEISNGKITRYNKAKNEKLEFVDYGLFSFLTKDLVEESLKLNSNSVIDLTIILKNLIGRQKLFGYLIDDPYFEIGTKIGITKTEHFLKGTFPSA